MRGLNPTIGCFVAVVVAVGTAPANAQWNPYDSFYFYYWSGIGERNFNQTRQLHEQNRLNSQALSQNLNLRIGSDVRSAPLPGPQSRPPLGASEEPSSREWWLRQQIGASRALAAARPPLANRDDTSSTPAAEQTREGAIRWPALLQEQLFSADRAAIEAPFARYASGGAAVSVSEYQTIIERAALMKRTLDRIVGQTTAAEFRAAHRFLDQLVAESRARIEQLRTIANVRTNLWR